MRSRMLWIGVATLVACAGTPPPAPRTQPTPEASAPLSYDETVLAAQSYLDTGKHERAAELAHELIASDAERPDAHVVLGRAEAMAEHLAASAAAYETARRLGAKERAVFAELASVYDVDGRYEDAVGVYDAWIADHPDDAEMHQQRGLSLVAAGDLPAAVEALKTASRLAPSSGQVAQDLGYALLSAGRPQDAARVLEPLVQHEPDRQYARLFLAQALVGMARVRDALATLEPLAQNEQPPGQATLLRARLQVAMGVPEAACPAFAALLQHNPDDPSLILATAGCYIAVGRTNEGRELVAAAKAKVGEHPLVAFRETQLRVGEGDVQGLSAMMAYAEEHAASAEAWRAVLGAAEQTSQPEAAAKARSQLQSLGFAN